MTLHREVDALHACAASTAWREEMRLTSDIPALHARLTHLLPRVTSAAARARLVRQQQRLAALQRALVERETERHADARREIRAGGLRGEALLAWVERRPPLERDLAVEQLLGVAHRPLVFQHRQADVVDHVPSGLRQVLHAVTAAPVTSSDVFVDIGSGLGKVALLVHLLTGARVLGIELQPALVDQARACAAMLGLAGVSFTCADVRDADLTAGDVFYMYLPFRGAILDATLARLRAVAETRAVVVCTGSMEHLDVPWLRHRATLPGGCAIHDGTPVPRAGAPVPAGSG